MKYRIIPITCFQQNSIIIWCEATREAILVDPGGEKEKICKIINSLNIKVKKILLTHGHIDHVGAATALKEYYMVPIIGPHNGDRFLLNNLFLQCQFFGIEYQSCVIPDIWLNDGDQIKVGNKIFDVLHCPGHSPGHVVFWNKLHKLAITGDVLFRNKIGRTDLPGGNIKVLISSIKNKLLTLLKDEVIFLPGHGSISTIGYERKNNVFLQ